MMKRFGGLKIAAVTVAATGLIAFPAWAGYLQPGYDLQVVQSGQGLAHTSALYQMDPTWAGSGLGVQINTSFASRSCQTIDFARLYLDIWGGTSAYTSTVTVSVNGTSLAPVSIGGTGDANPTFNASKTCVYGTGAGMWEVAYASIDGLLKKDGTLNAVSFKVADPTGNFDGRTVSASLISIYTDPTVNQTLDYCLAEADGTMRNTPGVNGSPSQRTLTFTGIDTTDVTSATYIAGFTHGTTGQKDQIYFNGTTLGGPGNDVALGTTSDYGPSNIPFDVTGLLSSSSTVRYSVDAADVGTPGEAYLRANIGLLEVTHPVPEPALLTLMATGAGVLIIRRRRTR